MASTIEDVDRRAFALLSHTDDETRFCAGAHDLGELAMGVPQAMNCSSLRLVARVAKVLRMLSGMPGPRLIAMASNWAEEVLRMPEVSKAEIDQLLKVRDAGLSEGSVSAAAAADVRWLPPKVLQAAKRLSLEALCQDLGRASLRACPLKAGSAQEDSERLSSDNSQTSTATVPGDVAMSAAPSNTGAESQKGQKRQSFPRNPCHGSIRTTLCVSADIFLDPVANDLPKTEGPQIVAAKRVRSAAPVLEGASSVSRGGGSASLRRPYTVWTELEEWEPQR
ncbi:unnamed protein product, partial [Effrenium voratum]